MRVTKSDCAIVVVRTDSDIHGIGETCAYGIVQADGGWGGLTEAMRIAERFPYIDGPYADAVERP